MLCIMSGDKPRIAQVRRPGGDEQISRGLGVCVGEHVDGQGVREGRKTLLVCWCVV